MLGGPDRNPGRLFQKGQMCVVFPLRAAFWRVPTHQHSPVCLRCADSKKPSKGLLPSDSSSKTDPMPASSTLMTQFNVKTADRARRAEPGRTEADSSLAADGSLLKCAVPRCIVPVCRSYFWLPECFFSFRAAISSVIHFSKKHD